MSKILPIYIHPHEVLQRVATPCAGATPEVLTLGENMLATLALANGLGLAAPQVGQSVRLIVIDMGEPTPDGRRNYAVKRPEIIVNPEIIERSPETATMQEGCLSLPGLWAEVERNAWVKVRYTNRDGAMIEEVAQGLRAAVFQHEIDHLNGTLFTDRLTATRKALAMPKWQKLRTGLLRQGGEFDLMAAEKGLISKRQPEEE